MKFLICFVVFWIFDINTAIKSKSVNLALETVLEFDNRDNSGDVQFINNVQSFLDKIKTIINKNQDGRRSYRNLDENFTEFLKNAIVILKSYDDEDLEDVFAVVDNELRKYHYKGCKFYELIENTAVRRYMATKLNDVRSKSAEEIRYKLKQAFKLLIEENYDRRVKDFLDYINSLYRSEAKYKFRSFLNNLANYKSKSKRANLDLIKIVREGIRSILFDHYTDLNQNARRELKLKVETFWKELSNPQYIRHKVWNIKYTRSIGDRIGKFNVVQLQQNLSYPLNMSLANYSMTSTTTKGRQWTLPTKIGWNMTMPKSLPFNWTFPTWRTTAKTKTTTKRTTKKKSPPKKGKKPKKLLKHGTDYYASDERNKLVTLFKEKTKYRPHRYRTTDKGERLHTLWEEDFNLSAEKPAKTIISHHEAQIDVQKTNMPKYHKNKHDRNKLRQSSQRKPHRKYSRYHKKYNGRYTSPKFRISEHSPGTTAFRKSLTGLITSEEGMSIESFENGKAPRQTISYRKSNINDTFGQANVQAVDSNVMRRINDLEREIQDMKSIIKVETPTPTTANIIDDNYALDFWEGTTKIVYFKPKTTTIKTPTSMLTTAPYKITDENNSQKELTTVTPVMELENIIIPLAVKEFSNITRGGAVLNKVSLIENKTKLEPFIDNNTINTMKDVKKDNILVMDSNFTTTPILEFDPKVIDTVPTFENNVTMLVDENIRNKLEAIFKNLTTPYSVWPANTNNTSMPPEFEDPFKGFDTDFI